MGMERAIAYIRNHRQRVHGDVPIAIGMNSPWLYIGTPTFEVPAGTCTGTATEIADTIRQYQQLGVSHTGVRFRSRSCEEFLDQIEAFGSEVAPLLTA